LRLSGVNGRAAESSVSSIPVPIELQHDFLWRTTRDLQERERMAFSRSHYEEVMIARVHPKSFAAKQFRMPRSTTRRSGMSAIVRSLIWRSISTPAQAISWRVSTRGKRNSTLPT
jgi:polyphosphate kinase 2 (PPK2 family)